MPVVCKMMSERLAINCDNYLKSGITTGRKPAAPDEFCLGASSKQEKTFTHK